MHQVVERALNVIAAESSEPEYTEAFSAARAVVLEFGEENLADRLFADIPDSISFMQVARLFDFLAWQTEDNGSAMTRAIERWLVEGTNLRKVQIALNLDVYPFLDEREMDRVLSDVAVSLPEMADRCQQIISSRKSW
ncbi:MULTISPECIES: hypothetical protein [Pseudomonas]|uniref:Uncharacterized protein n=2 Tax=Pseudomonas TaxID=286 RepID=A0A2C5W694_PSEPU|nr:MULTISPECIES: hypothetical protein [Pseudomonas]PHH39154.1 hypothetical protein CRX57_02895 [Pseudomonas putida]QBX41845.1 hypothetical protein E4T63_15110 [Pseudomonas fluorescens]